MNAIDDWKTWYRASKVKWYNPPVGAQCRHEMKQIRREAALERKLAAAQRKANDLEIRLHAMHDELIHVCDEWGKAERAIEALQSQVWRLEAQEHNRDDGNEWEKEYYLRGMHR